MARFDSVIATVLRLIEKNGQAVTWNSVADSVPNSAEPWNVTVLPPIPRNARICFVPPKDNEWRKLLAYLKGTEVPISKLAGLMGAVNFTPKITDFVNRAGVDLKIANIDVLAPNGQIVLYTIEFEA